MESPEVSVSTWEGWLRPIPLGTSGCINMAVNSTPVTGISVDLTRSLQTQPGVLQPGEAQGLDTPLSQGL